MDRVRLAVDLCSNLQGFFVLHSFGGGTGSGVGCEVLHDLHEATNGAGWVCRFLCGAPSFLFFGWCQRKTKRKLAHFLGLGGLPIWRNTQIRSTTDATSSCRTKGALPGYGSILGSQRFAGCRTRGMSKAVGPPQQMKKGVLVFS